MADRYAVSAGNWNDNNTWAATSGGAPGASFPVAGDNAFFDAASGAGTYTVNVSSACANLDFTGFTRTFAGSAALAVGGNIVGSSGFTRTYTGAITMSATTTGKTITMNGMVLASAFTFSGAGGGWTLQDTFNCPSSSFTLSGAGATLDTNGQTVTISSVAMNDTGSAKTLTLGASTINAVFWTAGTATGNVLNAGSSTINVTQGGGGFGSGGFTYGTVNLINVSSGASITGAGTFGNLSMTGAANKVPVLSLWGNLTVTGTLKYLGNSAVNRLLIQSNTVGTARTITAAAIDAASDFCDFMDITGAGAAAPFATGTSLGDCQGNGGITFTTPATQTATGTASFTWSTHGWTSRVPLPQDDVVIPNAFVAGRTITMDMPRAGKNITFSCTGNPALAWGASEAQIFGSLVLAAGMTINAGNNSAFAGRGSYTMISAGVTWSSGLTLRNGGTMTLLDAFVQNTATPNVLLANGSSMNTGGFSVTHSGRLTVGVGSTLTLGASTWTLDAIGVQAAPLVVQGSVSAGTSLFRFKNYNNATSLTFGGATWNNFEIYGSGSGVVTVVGSNTFNDFKDSNTVAHTIQFTGGTTQHVSSFSVNAAGVVGKITLASTNTTAWNLVKDGGGKVGLNNLSISRSTATPADTWYAGNESTDGGNNSGWTFGTMTIGLTGVAANDSDVGDLSASAEQNRVDVPEPNPDGVSYTVEVGEAVRIPRARIIDDCEFGVYAHAVVRTVSMRRSNAVKVTPEMLEPKPTPAPAPEAAEPVEKAAPFPPLVKIDAFAAALEAEGDAWAVANMVDQDLEDFMVMLEAA